MSIFCCTFSTLNWVIVRIRVCKIVVMIALLCGWTVVWRQQEAHPNPSLRGGAADSVAADSTTGADTALHHYPLCSGDCRPTGVP